MARIISTTFKNLYVTKKLAVINYFVNNLTKVHFPLIYEYSTYYSCYSLQWEEGAGKTGQVQYQVALSINQMKQLRILIKMLIIIQPGTPKNRKKKLLSSSAH